MIFNTIKKNNAHLISNSWFSDNNYKKLIHEDLIIKDYVENIFNANNFYPIDLNIKRNKNKLIINLFLCSLKLKPIEKNNLKELTKNNNSFTYLIIAVNRRNECTSKALLYVDECYNIVVEKLICNWSLWNFCFFSYFCMIALLLFLFLFYLFSIFWLLCPFTWCI